MTPERHAHLARSLIALCGGLDAAAAITRAGRSQLSNYQNSAHASVMPADVMAELERQAGVPIYSSAIADACNVQPCADLIRAVADLDFAASDLAHVSIHSVRPESPGGETLTPNERRTIAMKASAARRFLATVAAHLSAAGARDVRTDPHIPAAPSARPHRTDPASPHGAAPLRASLVRARLARLRGQSSSLSGVPRADHRATGRTGQLEN